MSRSVALLDGKQYVVPRLSPYSTKAEPVRARLIDMNKVLSGGLLETLHVQVQKANLAIERLSMMTERADIFIKSDKSSEPLKEKYFVKTEEYNAEQAARENDLENAIKETADANGRMMENAHHIAVFALSLPPNNLTPEQADEVLDADLEFRIACLALGLRDPESDKKPEEGTALTGDPLSAPTPSTSGDGA